MRNIFTRLQLDKLSRISSTNENIKKLNPKWFLPDLGNSKIQLIVTCIKVRLSKSPHMKGYIILSLFIIVTIIYLPSEFFSLYPFQNVMAEAGRTTTAQCTTSYAKPQVLSTTSNTTLSVFGTIDLSNSSIKLSPFMVLPGLKYTVRPTNSSFSIDLLDSKGKTLVRYPFDPKVYTSIPPNNDKMALISEAIPYIPCAKEIVIAKENKELASRKVDDYSPKVRIIYPIGGETLTRTITLRWQASDPDGDSLTYYVFYSPDAGRSWQNVASGIKDTELRVNLAALPGSALGLFRIIATDGVNTGISDSNSTFNVPATSSTAG